MHGWKRLAVVTALGVVACGDDDPKGGGSSSALDAKKVSELNGSELKSLCDWFIELDAKSNISDEQFCTQDAAEWAESSDECEELREECLADLAAEDEDTCEDFSVGKSCTVEVKALKTCISDLAKAYDAKARTASCDKYEDAIVDELPASCDDIPEDCIVLEVSVSSGSLRRR